MRAINLFFCLVLWSAFSCKEKSNPNLPVAEKKVVAKEEQNPPIVIKRDYNYFKKNLIDKNCLICHNSETNSKHPSRLVFETPEDIIQYSDDIIYATTEAFETFDNEMPPSKSGISRVNSELIDQFKKWKDDGFTEVGLVQH